MSNSWFHFISRWVSLEQPRDLVKSDPSLCGPPKPIEKEKSFARRRSDNLSLADAMIELEQRVADQPELELLVETLRSSERGIVR